MQTLVRKVTKADRTRNYIVEKTADLFNKKGYSGTSMSDVEVITGLSRGGIYRSFENKEMIALAVFDYNMSKIIDLINEKSKQAKSFHDQLLVFPEVYKIMASDTILMGGSPLGNTASEADDTNNLLRERASKALIKKENTISDIIVMGIGAGEFKKESNAKLLAHTMVAMLEGALMVARAMKDRSRIERMAETIDEMISQIRV